MLAGERRGALDGDRRPRPPLRADAAHRVLRGHGAPEHRPGDDRELVGRPVARLREVRGGRRVADHPLDAEAEAGEGDEEALAHVGDLGDRGVGEPSGERARVDRRAGAGEPGVERLAVTPREGEAGERAVVVERGVHRDGAVGAVGGQALEQRGCRLAHGDGRARPLVGEQLDEA